MLHKDNFAVIMAGGIGSRFWPMSRTRFPKQFHDILGTGETLIQMTWNRLRKICPTENIFVVTNQMYSDLVCEQLPEIGRQQVIGEPSRRNTAPCIAYASYKIKAINPNANIVVAPSDHLILKEDTFVETIELALQQANVGQCLVTLGIRPSRPDTGYGYIQFNQAEKEDLHHDVRKVKTFTEKPQLPLAEQFIESGDFYWNSGIFIWKVENILRAFDAFLPDMSSLFKEGEGKYNTPEEDDFIQRIYPICQNESIDFGVMEKAGNVYVVLADFGWSDLGTWGSLYTHLEKDDAGNAAVGEQVHLYNAANNVINVPNDKLVVLQGLNDYIVIESDGVLLICKKQEEQKIKQFVNDIKLSSGETYI